MSLLDQVQPGAQEQMEELRARRREADAARQAEKNDRLAVIALGNNGIVPPDEARKVTQDVTGEIPIPVLDPSPVNEATAPSAEAPVEH